MLAEEVSRGEVIKHNLEGGLGVERAMRSLLENFLPARYGVAKGKIVNNAGDMSRHCDAIIYDRLDCPRIFIDGNENQVLPVEGVYAVLEIKTTLTKHTVTEAFDNLRAVYDLQPERPIQSENDHIDHRPPILAVVGFKGLKLPTLEAHFRTQNAKHAVPYSSSSFSRLSSGYANLTGETFLVHKIACLESGSVFHMLDGSVVLREWGEYTLGMLLSSLLSDFEQISLQDVNFTRYFHYGMVEDPEYFNRNIRWL